MREEGVRGIEKEILDLLGAVLLRFNLHLIGL